MYPIILELSDCDAAYPGYLYPPGCPVSRLARYADTTECAFCGHPMTHAGSADPLTGRDICQRPEHGEHDGIVSGAYAPVTGAPLMESDYSHLRCVAEACESGVATLTVGCFDPLTWQDTPTGRHAVSA